MRNLLSIKEFSELSGIHSSTLRYWDEIGLFSPVKRDTGNNYRYYSPEQIITVNFLTVMKSLDVPLKTISEIVHERTPDKIVSLIEQQEKRLAMEMYRLQKCVSVMHTRRELIKHSLNIHKKVGVSQAENKPLIIIDVLPQDEFAFIRGEENQFKNGDENFYGQFIKFRSMADDLRIKLSFPVGGYHRNMESFQNAPEFPDRFISLDPTGNNRREAGEYLTGYTKGYYGQLGELPERMCKYAKEHSLRCVGPVYSVYLQDEVCVSDPSQYMVQVTVAVVPV